MNIKTCVVCSKNLSGKKTMYCSGACKQKHHYIRVKEQTNTYHSQTLRALKRKIELVSIKGGSCINCGYNKNLSALHFHHVDPSKKEFKLDLRKLGNSSMKVLLKEIDKCLLLCANCHAEEHNPEYTLENVQRIISSGTNEKSLDVNGVNSGKS